MLQERVWHSIRSRMDDDRGCDVRMYLRVRQWFDVRFRHFQSRYYQFRDAEERPDDVLPFLLPDPSGSVTYQALGVEGRHLVSAWNRYANRVVGELVELRDFVLRRTCSMLQERVWQSIRSRMDDDRSCDVRMCLRVRLWFDVRVQLFHSQNYQLRDAEERPADLFPFLLPDPSGSVTYQGLGVEGRHLVSVWNRYANQVVAELFELRDFVLSLLSGQ